MKENGAKKTAVVLFNLGGPDSLAAVPKFLFNLFNDAAIIRLPQPFRFLVAKLIATRRTAIAQNTYAKLGGASPLRANTEVQARALEEKLGAGFRCFIAMRYWRPFIDEAAAAVKTYAPDNIVLLPLYPQFSTTTTGSSLKAWKKVAKAIDLDVPTKTICCYEDEAGFIGVLATGVRKAYEEAKTYGSPRLLLSAHGLPEKIVRAGDPYPWQCERTAEALKKALGLDVTLCYQSRVGPLAWIGPSTEDEIRKAGRAHAPIVIVPIAFVSEHVETLIEIDQDYRALARDEGSPFFVYVPAVGIHDDFIGGLAGLVRRALTDEDACLSGALDICPRAGLGCAKQGARHAV